MGDHGFKPWMQKREEESKTAKSSAERKLVCSKCGRQIRGQIPAWDTDGYLCARCFEEKYKG